MISQFQRFYSLIFSPFAGLTQKCSIRFRNAVIFLCTFFIASYYFFSSEETSIPYIEGSRTKIHLICGFFLLVIVIFSVSKALKPVRWNRLLFYLMFFFGLGIMIVSMLHPVGSGYRVFSLLLMLGFPALYYVWNNRGDYNTLFRMFSISFILTGSFTYILFIYLSLSGKLSMDGSRAAPNMHPNLFAMFGMGMIISAVYLLFLKGPDLKWIIINTLAIGIGLDSILLGQSRSCLLTAFGSLVCAAVFFIKLRRVQADHYRTVDLIILLLFLLLFIVVFRFIGARAIDYNAEKKAAFAYTPVITTVAASSDTGGNTTTKDDDLADRFNMENNDLDSFSSGRISIWKWYYSHLNLWGNNVFEVTIEKETGTDFSGAHNTPLEYAFRFGVPVALLNLLLELLVGCLSLWVLFGKRFTDPAYLFTALAVMTYAIQSMVEIALLPFNRQAVLLFYLAIMPLLPLNSDS